MAHTANRKPRAIGTGAAASGLQATLAASLAILKATPVRQRRVTATAAHDIAKTADQLARMMADLHGAPMVAHVDHGSGFVLIRQRHPDRR
jgi:hypothetical protein